MANIQPRRNADGRLISYRIRVFRGRGKDGKQLKPAQMTFAVEPGWTEKTALKKATAAAAVFEKQIKEGTTSDSRQRFDAYCDYVIDLKDQNGAKHSTIFNYRAFTERIYPSIGHFKLKDIRAEHLNRLYTELAKDGQNKRTGGKLSGKTRLEIHRLIHIVLEQAVREGLVPFNVADRVEPPKAERKDVNYYQPEEVAAIREALETEPIEMKTFVHLLLVTGARRGEILGLKWDAIDFKGCKLHICNTVQYRPGYGVYEATPKTKQSDRFITMPKESMQLLRTYHRWQLEKRLRLGELYQDQGFVFAGDTGAPLHPDSIGTWLSRFADRHGLPHLNCHAFRHTMASLLYYNGVDSVSISKRLGHSMVSTTADIYAHVIEAADQRNADILEEVILKSS